MAGRDHLAAAGGGCLLYVPVDLALPQYLKVGVGLVEQQHGTGIGVHVREDQQSLLKPPAAGGEIKRGAVLAVAHGYLAPLVHVAGLVEVGPEQVTDLPGEPIPLLGPFTVDAKAEISQHFSGAALADPHVDRTLFEAGLGGGQARHRRQEGHLNPVGLGRDGHAFRGPALGESQGAAVERLLVGVVELQPAGPRPVAADTFHQNLDADVASSSPAVRLARVAGAEIAPQQVGGRRRNGHQVSAIDCDPGRPPGSGRAAPPGVPALQARAPQRQRLHGRGLARVVGSDEQDGVAEFDLDAVEALEVVDGEVGQHGGTLFGGRHQATA